MLLLQSQVGNVERAGGGLAWEATPKDSTKAVTGSDLGFASAGGAGATDRLTGGAPVKVGDYATVCRVWTD